MKTHATEKRPSVADAKTKWSKEGAGIRKKKKRGKRVAFYINIQIESGGLRLLSINERVEIEEAELGGEIKRVLGAGLKKVGRGASCMSLDVHRA